MLGIRTRVVASARGIDDDFLSDERALEERGQRDFARLRKVRSRAT
jgi:hypothetical protein